LKNKSKYLGPTINLNINKDDSDLNDFLYSWEQFESRPNKIVIHNAYASKQFIEFFSNNFVDRNFFTEVIPSDDEYELIINDKMFVKLNDNVYCSYIVIDKRHEKSVINEISFYYKNEKDFEFIQNVIEELNKCIVNFEENEYNKLNTISINSGSLEIEPVDISIDLDNFDMYYSKSTSKEIKKLIKEIKKSSSGLSILYGERGLGKTSVINYIASELDRIVIFIPNNMIEHTINNPDFRKFLKRYVKPILVIDDCEMLFSEYFNKSNTFTNNLLQLVDGFLSETIEANVIAIFNTDDEDEIDHSLLDANNLLRVIKFEYLSPEESVDLSEHLGYKPIKNKSKVLDIIKNKKQPKNKKEFGL
jgi:hypothetical protein